MTLTQHSLYTHSLDNLQCFSDYYHVPIYEQPSAGSIHYTPKTENHRRIDSGHGVSHNDGHYGSAEHGHYGSAEHGHYGSAEHGHHGSSSGHHSESGTESDSGYTDENGHVLASHADYGDEHKTVSCDLELLRVTAVCLK